jgi:hypothetical protein
MSDLSLNQQVIAEFRANGGRVGGYLEGALVVLVHHRGRLSGSEYVHRNLRPPDCRDIAMAPIADLATAQIRRRELVSRGTPFA